ncbi:hypothetical protein [Actinomadura sp. NTSP31]|uniref:hypothetical protein n=1 Tax=Actinomadura sp. NTSP31 TaxID=1735447 RepID=UPI0035C1D98D
MNSSAVFGSMTSRMRPPGPFQQDGRVPAAERFGDRAVRADPLLPGRHPVRRHLRPGRDRARQQALRGHPDVVRVRVHVRRAARRPHVRLVPAAQLPAEGRRVHPR